MQACIGVKDKHKPYSAQIYGYGFFLLHRFCILYLGWFNNKANNVCDRKCLCTFGGVNKTSLIHA